MSLFYSEKYVTPEGVAVFRIYSLILLFRATYWGIVLNAMGKTKFIFYSSVATLGFNCVGNIACYYLFGFIGPAISSLIVIALMGFAQLLVTSKILRMPFSKICPWRKMCLFLTETAIIGFVFYAVKYWLLSDFSRLPSIIISIGLGGVWGIVYILCNFKLLRQNWKNLNQKQEGTEHEEAEEIYN